MDFSDNIKKRTSLTAVFYNRSFGFMVVPYAVERNMRCHIAIEPTIILPPKTSFDELGSAVKETIKIATNAPETDIEKNVNEFWKKTKYKGFRGFSNHFQSINVNLCEDMLKIKNGFQRRKKDTSRTILKNLLKSPLQSPTRNSAQLLKIYSKRRNSNLLL